MCSPLGVPEAVWTIVWVGAPPPPPPASLWRCGEAPGGPPAPSWELYQQSWGVSTILAGAWVR
jgi:hypothetical protein